MIFSINIFLNSFYTNLFVQKVPILRQNFPKTGVYRGTTIRHGRVTPERTKLHLYSRLNPDLSVHPLYQVTDSQSCVEDNLRITFSRIRLCSHRLRSETGRWNRVPSGQRFCPHCEDQSIQDEEHLLQCPATLPLRTEYTVGTDLQSLLAEPSKTDLICLKKCLKLLESTYEPNLID